jgi:hypothetical protein
LDDNCLDAVLGDGIHGQTLQDNICYQELSSQSDLRKAIQNEKFIVSSKKYSFSWEVTTTDSVLNKKNCLCNDIQHHHPLLNISIIPEHFIFFIG